MNVNNRVFDDLSSGHVVGVSAAAWRADVLVAGASPVVLDPPHPARVAPAMARAATERRDRLVSIVGASGSGTWPPYTEEPRVPQLTGIVRSLVRLRVVALCGVTVHDA